MLRIRTFPHQIEDNPVGQGALFLPHRIRNEKRIDNGTAQRLLFDFPISCYTDARTKKIYWRYKHPITGKFHGLGDDEEAARAIAVEANSRLAEVKMTQLIKVKDEISRKIKKGISVTSWLNSYMDTGQRLGYISKLRFDDVWDDHLHIIQEKTGTKLAIPLNLKCEKIGFTLRDVIARYRDRILSPHVLYYHHTTSQAKRGGQVSANAITAGFKKIRDETDFKWEKGTPPSFHEQRSLSERLYREQGVDTKTLLGHKSQLMTDKYHDDRGKDWTILAVK
ncbi:phage integrase Arm DNA-binding domain-containing protein [Xenorhabdus sp. PB62.4]|uniref:phage integrase Arm DNA-binding domain-containing protein n=1 Tax=Xenorhabdus sp. PB62.4 TaxID=1851573 RepID=UPI001656B2EC|nr:phage integrase Arm DNA-binding domain-containing protein [Xenorhabdus sp. PB62.4]MBC8954211.1 integrase [Xenorhabdus sp. PB62.4]